MGVKDNWLTYNKIGLDTNLFIYAFEQHPQYGEIVKSILDKVEEGVVEAVTSTITLTEILTNPIREGNQMLEKRYRLLFTHFPNLAVVPVDVSVAEQAAYLRGKYRFKTPDALILASSIVYGAKLFITNDQRMKKVTEIHTMSINEVNNLL